MGNQSNKHYQGKTEQVLKYLCWPFVGLCFIGNTFNNIEAFWRPLFTRDYRVLERNADCVHERPF